MSLRLAQEGERKQLVDYLSDEPEFNLFILGDIHNSGLHTEDCDVYIQWRESDIDAVLLRFRDSLVPYTHDTTLDLAPLATQVNALLDRGGYWCLNGKLEVVQALRPLIARSVSAENTEYFSVCRSLQTEFPLHALQSVRKAEPSDADEIADLWDTAFEPKPHSKLREDLESGEMVATVVRDAGRLAAAAAHVAATDWSAMIIGVATYPSHRRKGYGSACVYRLTSMLRDEGKSACLFFHNPEAGAIYHRLGFEDIGMWERLEFK